MKKIQAILFRYLRAEAHYREEGKPTVELVFAKDFDVTYKNNTDVGTADLTIHGKGAYKGQKLTTFNIAR
ncbi:MAG: hypothetical protein LBT48_04805 [Prevotellaceae bacterium]|jgi:hypothetical protein|nr:hypothetical protein [Prevotellaceae bacterium]